MSEDENQKLAANYMGAVAHLLGGRPGCHADFIDKVELMWIMDEALLEAGHGRHILTMGGQFEIVLGRGVKVTRSGLHVAAVPPETALALLPGRRASDLVNHPVLRDFVIDDIEVRGSGMIVRVSPF